MTGRDRTNDDQTGLVVMLGAGLCILGWAAWSKWPQASFLLIGGVAGAVATFAPTLNRRAGRILGFKLIAAGLITGALFFALAGWLGADAQMRRFERAWDSGSNPAAAAKHPWATIPLCASSLCLGAGAILAWSPK